MSIRFSMLLWIFIFLCCSSGYGYALPNNNDYHYTIHLVTTKKATKQSIKKSLSRKLYVYAIKFTSNNNLYSHRIGFFKNKVVADKLLKRLPKKFKGAFVRKITNTDKTHLNKWLNIKTKRKKSRKILSIKKQQYLLERASKYFYQHAYKKAIPLLNKLYQNGSGEFRKQGLELLGICRERNNQLAHAVAEYRTYLKLYSDDKESSRRVSQRLMALLTANKLPVKAPGRKAKELSGIKPSWQYYGAVFQFYDKNEIDLSNNSQIVSAEQLSTNVSLSSRLIDSQYKIKTQFNAIHSYDLEDEETDDERITRLYIDILSPTRDYSIKAGRQRSSYNGVFGRFDGFDLGYRLNSRFQLKLVSGYPVEIHPTVKHHDDKSFNSIGLNITPENKLIDYHFFVIEQIADGLIDRKEFGAEFRYRSKNKSITSLLDYSTQYEKINYFVTIANWKFVNKSSLNMYLDYRQSPFLSTTSALQGQVGVSSLSDLLLTFSEDEIEQLSLDRSAISKSLTLKYTMVHNDKIKYQSDFSVSSLDGTVSSAGVVATADTGEEYSLAFSLLGKKWLMKHDNYLFRIRASDLANSDAVVFDATARYRFNREWRLGPRFRKDSRDYDDGREVEKDRVSLRFDYRRNRKIKFELDVSVENKSTSSPTAATQRETDQIIHLGYIYTF